MRLNYFCQSRLSDCHSLSVAALFAQKRLSKVAPKRREDDGKTTFADQNLNFDNQASCECSKVHMRRLMLIKPLVSGTEDKRNEDKRYSNL